MGAALVAALAAQPDPLTGQLGDDLEAVTLQLRWEYEFQFAGFVAARELGFYREAGFEVELRELHYGMSVYEELTSGRADYAVGTTDAVVARAEGVPVVAVASIFQHSPFVFIARADAGIRSPHDLAGRAVSTYDTRNTILEAMLHYEGIDPGQVELVPYQQEYEGFISGERPVTSAMITLQPWVFDRLGLEYTVMHPRTYGIDFYGNTLLTLEEELRERPERVRAFREASLRGWRYAMEHPDEIIDIYLESYAPHLERGLLEYEARATTELIRPELVDVGHMNPGRWRRVAEQYRALGVIDRVPDMEAFLYDPEQPRDLSRVWRVMAGLGVLTLVVSGVAGALFTLNRRLRRAQAGKQRKIAELQAALSEIRLLREMLPICSACKKIRNDGGFWENVESYIAKHTDTVFSHGICPDCHIDLYPDFPPEEEEGPGHGPDGRDESPGEPAEAAPATTGAGAPSGA